MLTRSARIVDGLESLDMRGLVNGGASTEAAAVGDGIALVEAFSNVVALRTEPGLECFDVSHALLADDARLPLRRWDDARVDTVVYTHGHVDHVTGADVFDSEADRTGGGRIRYFAHEAVLQRFDRYALTN